MMADGDDGNSVSPPYPIELQRRLALLRREHPAAALDVDLIRADGDLAVVKASISLPGAGSVSSLGVVSGEEIGRAIEQAERRAIERALTIASSSIPAAETPAAIPTPITNRQPPAPQPAPVERRPPAPIRTNAPIDIGASRPAPTAPSTRPQPAPAEGEPVLADYSWTAFWSWARENGLTKQGDIEQIIGQSYENLTPAEVRKLILAKRGG